MTPPECLPLIQAATQALSGRKEEVNRLNVFPVPDGDTGTNMSLTVETVLQEVSALPPSASLADVCKAVTHGSLMGARGNSGVITSQILRGICEGIAGAKEFDAATIAAALERANEVARNAVSKPVEGTILTVLADMAKRARTLAGDGATRDEALAGVTEEAFESVMRTPKQLKVLEDNGVVDAGGFGLALLVEGFTRAVLGSEAMSQSAYTVLSDVASDPVGSRVAIEQVDDWDDSTYLYCTEFLLKSDDIDVEESRVFLSGLGDCELMVGAHPDFKVHVHTDVPGSVLTYMTERGQVSEVHVHNMRIQSAERNERIGREGTSAHEASAPAKQLGFVAVCAGKGTQELLVSAGVDLVVRGGQTMNPSTKDFVDAINAVNAEQVVVFPNNKNVILAASAAAEIVDKATHVVPTTSVPQSFSALFAADPAKSIEENVALMKKVITQVRCAEITTAIKNGKAENGLRIKTGDVIGIDSGAIVVTGKEVGDVAVKLVEIIASSADVLTMLAGEDLAQADFESIVERIETDFPELEVDAQRGDQPLYPLVMAAE
ncbi:MAG: DAK2 domain-containing protein [Coriobacteriales bacterium]|jgi:DAK2 domain fusion protein YloV|nr:DAK2 domain-containing protein [Coriobacteriales bacterium]